MENEVLMIIIEFIVVLLFIFLGVRLEGIGIGFAGGTGVLALACMMVEPGKIPFDVISIIMAVIGAIASMQVAGGLDYLVTKTEAVLRLNPKRITIFAPFVTYWLTMVAGTGNISLSALPVIAEVAKGEGIKPCHPLSTAVVTAQVAIAASPISAAVVYMASVMEPIGVSYLKLLMVTIPSTFLGCMITALVVTVFFDSQLENDPIYQQRLKEGRIQTRDKQGREIKEHAKLSVLLFLLGVSCVVCFAVTNSKDVGLVEKPLMTTTSAILIIMMTVATAIVILCKIKTNTIINAATFKAGMSACICILGVAWLGDTFVRTNLDFIKKTASDVIRSQPWLLSVMFYFSSALLYSQAATCKALMPMAIELGVSHLTMVASFPALSGLFILPTYPTLVAAIQMDETGSTRIGKLVFNHPFIFPGTLAIVLSVVFGFILGSFVIT